MSRLRQRTGDSLHGTILLDTSTDRIEKEGAPQLVRRTLGQCLIMILIESSVQSGQLEDNVILAPIR